MLLNESRMASGPNLVPGLKECVESKGIPYMIAEASAFSFGLVINGLWFMYKSRKLIFL